MEGRNRARDRPPAREGSEEMAATITRQGVPGSTDGDLVMRHRYGDEEAFEELYARHERMVYNLALRLLGDREEAEEGLRRLSEGLRRIL